jgi:hypothetical protein
MHFAYSGHERIGRVRGYALSQQDGFVAGVAENAAHGIRHAMINEEFY